MKSSTTATNNSGQRALRVNPDWAKLPLFDRKGWKRFRFDQIAENIREGVMPTPDDSATYIGLEHMETGSLQVRHWGSRADLIGQKLRMRKGDVLFARRNAYLRRVAIAPHDGLFSAHGMILRAKPKVVLQEFLPFLMMSNRFMSRAEMISVGSLSPTINWTTLKLEEFALPPLPQQRRIAAILWAVDASQQTQSKTKGAVQALFEATVEHACNTNGERKKLADVLSYASDGPFGSKLKTEHYSKSGARVIRLQNIGDGRFDDADRAYIPDAYYADLRRYQVQAGDVIVAGLGDETHRVGRAALIPDSLGRAINKADCFCLRAKPNIISNVYLRYFLNSGSGSAQVKAQAQGTTRMRVNVGNLKSIEIPVPSRAEQDRIVERLEQIEFARDAIAKQIEVGAEVLTCLTNRLLDQQ